MGRKERDRQADRRDLGKKKRRDEKKRKGLDGRAGGTPGEPERERACTLVIVGFIFFFFLIKVCFQRNVSVPIEFECSWVDGAI